ncbi:MAG: HEAT repeat domain-containing protein [Verrucomicrobia bacterium]|nr:HEAT repeat domain-containing protein [Verrucomicrobiota bacterium]
MAEREDGRDAFKALGDQAAPYLLSVLTRPQPFSRPKTAYAEFRSKLPLYLKRVLPDVSTEDTASLAADELLRAIRPSAKVLMPRLKPWLSNPKHSRHLQAVLLLGTVGDGASEAVPFLVQALQSTNQYRRRFAVQSLQNVGTEARAAVPALLGALYDAATVHRAIRALGNIGPEARDAVPHLERFLASTHRYVAAVALHKINPDGRGLRFLIEAAKDPSSRSDAAFWLGELGPAAAPALDIVLEALRAETGRNRVGGPAWITIADALHRISPTNRAVIPVLLEKLEDAEKLARLNIATGSVVRTAYGSLPLSAIAKSDRLSIASRLVWFDPAEPHALEVLVETLRSDPEPGMREFAAYALRQAGPGARAAMPALKAALNDKHEGVRRSAASALRKIEQPGDK